MHSAGYNHHRVFLSGLSISANSDFIQWQSAYAPSHDFSLIKYALLLVVNGDSVFLPARSATLGRLNLLIYY
jgi:hypothetical protein